MGISTRQVTVTTTPTILVDNTAEAEEVHLHAAGGQKVFLGGTDVNTTAGFELDSGEKITLQSKNNPIYGVTESGSTVVQVLVIGL
jgi:hypothetical protein